MKIKELLEKLDELDEGDRLKYIPKLMTELSQVSVNQLLTFQRDWIDSDLSSGIKRPFKDFVKAQNDVIRFCCKIESSEFGREVRDKQGLPKLYLELEL